MAIPGAARYAKPTWFEQITWIEVAVPTGHLRGMKAALLSMIVSSFIGSPGASRHVEPAETAREPSRPRIDLPPPLDVPRLRDSCDSTAPGRSLGGPDLLGPHAGPFGAREPLLRPFAFLRGPHEGTASVWWWSSCLVPASVGSGPPR